MERYAAGDDAALGDVYEELAPRLMAHLVASKARSRPSAIVGAEEIVAQTMFHVHRARGSYVPGARVVPWAVAIADRLDDTPEGARRREARVASAFARVRRAYDTFRAALRERAGRGAAS